MRRDGYPSDWPQMSHAIKLRAGFRCERCGVRHLAWGWRDASGAFTEVDPTPLRAMGFERPPFVVASPNGPVRILEVVLAAAHLNHDRADRDPENLAALCQYCHVIHDRRQHAASAAITRHRQMRTPDLFGFATS